MSIPADLLAAQTVSDLANCAMSDADARGYLRALLKDDAARANAARAETETIPAEILKLIRDAFVPAQAVPCLSIGSGPSCAQLGPVAQLTSLPGPCAALPFPDKSFALITVARAYAFGDAHALFAEIRRVARSGAQLLMQEPVLPAAGAAADIVRAHFKIIDEIRDAYAHTSAPDRGRARAQHYKRADDWVALASGVGFKLVAKVAAGHKNSLTTPGDTICMLFADTAASGGCTDLYL